MFTFAMGEGGAVEHHGSNDACETDNAKVRAIYRCLRLLMQRRADGLLYPNDFRLAETLDSESAESTMSGSARVRARYER